MHRRHVLDVRRHAWLYCRAGRLVGRSQVEVRSVGIWLYWFHSVYSVLCGLVGNPVSAPPIQLL